MDEMKRRAFTAHEVKFRGVGLGRYMKFFSFSDGEISGKSILDVGAAQANFQAEAEMAGASVVSLDPAYAGKARRLPLDKNRKVAGRVQNLPFNSRNFDVVFARRVIPDKVHSIERYRSIIELLRVTKQGGWIGIGPFIAADSEADKPNEGLLRVKRFLNAGGYNFVERSLEVPIPPKNRKTQQQTYLKISNNGNLRMLKKYILESKKLGDEEQ